MSFYRSASVSHYKLILPRESAWNIMNELGQTELIHVKENNTSQILLKPFYQQVKRCEEGLIKIKQIEEILKDRAIPYSHTEMNKGQISELFEIWGIKGHDAPNVGLDRVESEIQKFWKYYNEMNLRVSQIENQIFSNRNNLAIIRAGEQKFGRSFFQSNQKRAQRVGFLPVSFEDHDEIGLKEGSSKLYFKTGVITIQDQLRFKKTVFRITKGNCFVHFEKFTDIFERILKTQSDKVVFFILFPGSSGSYLDRKLDRLITSYSNQIFDIPNDEKMIENRIKNLQEEYHQSQNLLTLNENELKEFLHHIVEPVDGYQFTKIEYFKSFLIKQREIYGNLNEMELYQNFIQGSIYVQTHRLEEFQKKLNDIEKQSKHPSGQIIVSQCSALPTYFQLNDYTRSAQEIVETYGIPRYQEANPSFFTTVTFPFLFGVMFGDIAHGLILFLFGIILNLKYRAIKRTFLKGILPYRYLFLMMGFFSTYCGFVYNDFMSISLNIFGSCYSPLDAQPNQAIQKNDSECVYPFGIDPVWAVAQNNLNFLNSLKMKIAVIIAVVHMTLGVCIKASNALYFKKYVDFFFEFVPQFLFMVLLFGYMDFLIVYKWLKPWPLYDPNAPSIITTMINLPLKLGKTEDCCGGQPMWGTVDSTSQNSIQLLFLVISAICVPLMLLPKPLIQIRRNKKKFKGIQIEEYPQIELNQFGSDHSPVDMASQKQNTLSYRANHQEPQEEASQIFVHQLIQTIEYVLGCISNTASYLRLWALSLAHSQLSEVFFNKTVEGGIVSGFSGIPIMLVGFVILAGATFGVLLCMDSMQCFLHTLRLHWVQFQNKFYKGDGTIWNGFSFLNAINKELAM